MILLLMIIIIIPVLIMGAIGFKIALSPSPSRSLQLKMGSAMGIWALCLIALKSRDVGLFYSTYSLVDVISDGKAIVSLIMYIVPMIFIGLLGSVFIASSSTKRNKILSGVGTFVLVTFSMLMTPLYFSTAGMGLGGVVFFFQRFFSVIITGLVTLVALKRSSSEIERVGIAVAILLIAIATLLFFHFM